MAAPFKPTHIIEHNGARIEVMAAEVGPGAMLLFRKGEWKESGRDMPSPAWHWVDGQGLMHEGRSVALAFPGDAIFFRRIP